MLNVRAWLPIGLAALGLAGASCGGGSVARHPLTNRLDPTYSTLKLQSLAALPFASEVAAEDDPDQLAAGMAESKFYRALGPGSAFTVLASTEVGQLLDRGNLRPTLAAFYKKWAVDAEDVDTDFIKKVAAAMKADAVVAGVVDAWYQRKIDVTESGTARTTVGIVVGLFDGATGKLLWIGRDENYKEALRYAPLSEQGQTGRKQTQRDMERTNLRTATGVYAPPDCADVVDIVVATLVRAFPARRL